MSWDHVRAMCCLPEQRGLLCLFSKHFHLTQLHHQSLSASFYALPAVLRPPPTPARVSRGRAADVTVTTQIRPETSDVELATLEWIALGIY